MSQEEEDVGHALIRNPVQSYVEYPEQQQQPTGFLDTLTSLKKPSDVQFVFPPLNDNEDDEKPFRFQHPHANQPEEYLGFGSDDEDDDDNTIEVSKPPKIRYSRPNNDWKEGLNMQETRIKAQKMIDELCIVKKKVPWNKNDYYEAKDLPTIFQKEIEDFVKYMSPTDEEHRLRLYVIDRIDRVVKEVWPSGSTRVFGSFDTKLYLPSSDLDIVVFCDQYGGSTAHRKLTQRLKSAGLAHNGKCDIIPARIPIIKFVDSIGQFHIDISFNMQTGVQASARLRENIIQYPALRSISVVIKQFLLMRGLNEVFSGGLGSFGLASTIISFLQLHPLIQSNDINQEENLNVLVIEFLDLYGRRLAYDDVGIALHNNGLYFEKKTSALNNIRPHSLIIQDPEEFSNDITRGSFEMRNIAKSMNRAYDILTGTFYELDEVYVRQNQTIEVQHWPDYRVRSILATIVNIQDSVLEHRKYVQQKYKDIEELVAEALDGPSPQNPVPSALINNRKRGTSDLDDYYVEGGDSSDYDQSLGNIDQVNLDDADELISSVQNSVKSSRMSVADSRQSREEGQLSLYLNSESNKSSASSISKEVADKVKQSLKLMPQKGLKPLQCLKKDTLAFVIYKTKELANQEFYTSWPGDMQERFSEMIYSQFKKMVKQQLYQQVEEFKQLYQKFILVDLAHTSQGGNNPKVLDDFIDRQRYDLVAFIVYTLQLNLPVSSDSALSYSAFKTRPDGEKYYDIAVQEVKLLEQKPQVPQPPSKKKRPNASSPRLQATKSSKKPRKSRTRKQ